MDLERPLRVLMLEDNAHDAELCRETLVRAGLRFELKRVSTRPAFELALGSFLPDVVLVDFNLPGFDGRDALEIIRDTHPGTPAIVVSGTLGDEGAIGLLKAGASDYVLKDRPQRLPIAIRKVVEEHRRRGERSLAQREFEANLMLLRVYQESSPDGILAIDAEGCVITHNQRFDDMWNLPRDLRNSSDRALLDLVLQNIKDPAAFLARVEYLYGHPQEKSYEQVEMRDGRIFDRFTTSMFDFQGRYFGRVWFFRDVTEHKRVLKALEESEVRFRMLIEDASDPVAIANPDGTIRYSSPATREMSGFDPSELVGSNMHLYVHPADAEVSKKNLDAVLKDPTNVRRFIARILRKGGTWRAAEVILRNRLGVAPIDGLVITMRDVTERELSQRLLAAVNATDAALVRASDEKSLAEQVCRIMVDIGGYRMAWIGFPQQDEQKSIKVAALAGEGGGEYLATAKISWADDEHVRGPTSTAIRTASTQVTRAYPAQSSAVEQHTAARECGYTACASIPLSGRNGVFGVLTLYAGDRFAFDDAEVRLLEQLSADVSYGIEAMRDRKQHALDLERLGQIMEATVQAIAATVEKRDAYTAGHQVRVARLCVAMVRELGYSPERVRGLELAAMIHDVGKIEIPAEILTKPRGLTALEYSLVKMHSQAGYEILRNIDFPWPIAQIVLQHHEKLDGSGYPRGLKGEEILEESRILTVADVVEAMLSHRPYRAGWGVDAALEEVSSGRGLRYDPVATDACVRLFRERGFTFDDHK